MPSVYIQSSVFLPTPSGGAGAVELLVSKMADGLAQRGWEVTLFGLHGSKVVDELPRMSQHGQHLLTISPTGSAEERERRLVAAMAKGSPDVIFDHSLYMLVGQRCGPYVAMSHGMAPLPSWAHNVVFTSQHHGRLHRRKDPQALLLGIDLADIPPVQVEPTWADGRITEVSMVPREGLFWAGRIMPYKRLHLACEIARLAKQPLRIAGPVIDERYAREVWDEYDVHDFSQGGLRCQDEVHVHYLGELPRARVLEEMAKARYFLFTSDEREPAGLVMLEAMACGTPVIAFDVNAAREYIGHGASGALVDHIAEAVTHIEHGSWCRSEDPARIGQMVRGWVEERFTIDHMVDRAEEYLRRAMAGERW